MRRAADKRREKEESGERWRWSRAHEGERVERQVHISRLGSAGRYRLAEETLGLFLRCERALSPLSPALSLSLLFDLFFINVATRASPMSGPSPVGLCVPLQRTRIFGSFLFHTHALSSFSRCAPAAPSASPESAAKRAPIRAIRVRRCDRVNREVYGRSFHERLSFFLGRFSWPFFSAIRLFRAVRCVTRRPQ